MKCYGMALKKQPLDTSVQYISGYEDLKLKKCEIKETKKWSL